MLLAVVAALRGGALENLFGKVRHCAIRKCRHDGGLNDVVLRTNQPTSRLMTAICVIPLLSQILSSSVFADASNWMRIIARFEAIDRLTPYGAQH